MENIVNLTGHDVTIKTPDGDIVIPPTGNKVNARYETRHIREIQTPYGKVPITRNFYHISKRLPPEKPGTWYIVSKIVAEVNPLRSDLLIINGLIRENHKPIGCRSLAIL